MRVSTRKEHWLSKRVFFATPQVIYNDIKSGICPGESLRCLVVDEAHRARGNYAYCQIVSTLTDMGYKTYRVLALSATPGSKVEDVVNVSFLSNSVIYYSNDVIFMLIRLRLPLIPV